MKIQNEKKLNMIITTITYLLNYTFLSMVPRYNVLFERLRVLVEKINELNKELLYSGKGFSQHKSSLKSSLRKQTHNFSNIITIFARENNMSVLLAEMKLSNTEIMRLTASTLLDTAKGIYQRALNYKEQLVDYGLQNDNFNQFEQAITEFETAIPSPRMNLTGRSQNRKEIEKIFKEINQILDDIDKLAEMYREKDEKFYNGYCTVRKIVNSRTSNLALKGIVTDAKTLEPVKGVILRFDPVNGTATPIKKRSAEKGGFRMNTIPPGVYILKAKKDGYIPKEEKIEVSEDATTEVKLEMEQA